MNSASGGAQLAVSHQRCEYLENPLGIDETQPRLGWRINSDRRGVTQSAYHIRVGSTPDASDLWNSGKVSSDASTHIAYAGKPLVSRQVCHWSVEVWDDEGRSVKSEPAFWTMGLLKPDEWRARWIAADPEIIRRDPDAIAPTKLDPGSPGYFRKAFHLPAGVKRAVVHASARGLFELSINGQRVGEDLFAPEWTDYNKRIQYRTYDVTNLLASGDNAIGAILGDGWWSGYVGWQETRGRYGSLENSLLVQLEIDLANGQTMTIATDATWRCDTGPTLFSDMQMGETYDARREQVGWNSAGFDERRWLCALVVAGPSAPLVALRAEPVRIMQELAPVSVNEIAPGVYIFDLGQNIAGYVRIRINAPAGTRVQIRHGERLSPDGTLYTENLRRAKATDTCITKGSDPFFYEPHFTFHGFQYIEIAGLPEKPSLGDVAGCLIHSATPLAGHFECSHPLVNRLWLNGLWSQRDNFLSVPTDCPQRDERLGWMGDAQVFLRTASYNMNVAAFFTKWMIDVEDAQTSEGIFPDVAPRLPEGGDFVGLDNLVGGAGWADAGVIVPWTIWRVYGDTRIVERHWNAMRAWLDYLERTNPDYWRHNDLGNNYGDWLCIPSDTSFRTHSPMKNLLATAYWADDAAKMAIMAKAIGKPDDARRCQEIFEKVRAAFQKEFVREDGLLTVQTQTAYLLALAMDLLPDQDRAKAAQSLVENIEALDWHLSTGFIGISHLNPTLTLAGHADVAYRLLERQDYPSWLYPVLHGATSIWERWNGWTHEQGFFNPHMNSFNHYSLGSVGEWLFRHVAGIELDPSDNGFKRFVLHPHPGGSLTFARATYETLHGPIESHWERDGERMNWTIRIPANTRARVVVPSDAGTTVSESGRILDPAEVRRGERYAVLELGAGTYSFESVYK